ncbi:E3 ubiquitin-protein ligase RNF113A [Cylas formicarius]|uniref:E3 ubiquitin-protein ligase RNF113A n=1 Tax=Cylas formicarius TaxID=197179 RepID=UPI00295885D0|nr:E3 ubiquitin-protein ligase RNF113A [Cylas formicarius]
MAEDSKTVQGESCNFIFKKRLIKGRGSRRRQSSSEDDNDKNQNESAEQSVVVKPRKRKIKENPNKLSTSKLQKKQSEDNEDSSSEDDVLVSYKSTRSAVPEGPQDQGATAILEIETQKDRDAQAIFEKRLQVNKDLEGKQDDKIYRGINNYMQYYKPKDTAAGNASSGLVRKGPIRAPENLRATVRWDYQPDICKDYKETGFCGFGDSCKFLHDRSDYKHGWQLEREWQEGRYGEDSDDDKKYEISSTDEELPTECPICKGEFVDPVVSKCNHYFCEKCALERYKKTIKCFVCNAQITTFNPGRKLSAKLNKVDGIKKESSSESE